MAGARCPDCGPVGWDDEGCCVGCGIPPSLGYGVVDWIEAHCAIPDRDEAGEPFLLTDEQYEFVVRFYRVWPDADRRELPFFWHRGAQLIRPQKWGKGPLAAALICAEAQGPTRFDGWDANGQPVGVACPTPWIELTAVSEAQTDNVWSSLLPMIRLGALNADLPDTGETRINLPGGGVIRPVTAAPNSRLGAKVTFALQDEVQSWVVANRGRKIADTQRRNVAGMGGRWLATGNAWDPNEGSVAQETWELGEDGVLFDDREPPKGSIRDDRFVRDAIRHVYGDSISGSVREFPDGSRLEVPGWVSVDKIFGEIKVLRDRDPGQAERYFLNRKQSGDSFAFDKDRFRELADPDGLPAGGLVVVGVDGARFKDALAVVACHVESAFMWPVGIWERPPDAPESYEHPWQDVTDALEDLTSRFSLWRALIDPQYIEALVQRWQGRWGADVFVPWYTNRNRYIAPAVRAFTEAIGAGEFRHSGDPVLTAHIGHAIKQPLNFTDEHGKPFWSLSKDRHDSPRKIDGAMAAVMAWEARGQAVAAAAQEPEPAQSWWF